MAAQMKQVDNIIGARVREAHVDMGDRGHDHDGGVAEHVDKRRRGRTSEPRWRWMKRRSAVEPSIGHLKSEHRLERNRPKGTAGNAINAILAAAAMNFQKLLGPFFRIFLLNMMRVCNGLLAFQGSRPELLNFNMPENHFFRIDYPKSEILCNVRVHNAGVFQVFQFKTRWLLSSLAN